MLITIKLLIIVRQLILFTLKSIIYGLAIAFVVLLVVPSLRPDWQALSKQIQQTAKAEHLTFSKAVQLAAPAVVTIYSRGFVEQPRFTQTVLPPVKELGSGVIMSKEGHILTNAHVVNQASQIEVFLQDGRQFQAQLLGSDTITDLALLKIDGSELPVIPQDPDFEPQVGDVVLAIGNPLNLGQTITQGIISAVSKKGLTNSDHTSFLQMDAAINVGNSGGALVNSNGVLVGINTAVFKTRMNVDIQGISFAVPYAIATRAMDKLMRYGRWARGWLGVTGHEVDAYDQQITTQNSKVAGFKITSLDPFGPAWQAGMQVDDVLLSLDNRAISSGQQALDIVAEASVGAMLNCKVKRNGQVVDLTLTVQEFPTK